MTFSTPTAIGVSIWRRTGRLLRSGAAPEGFSLTELLIATMIAMAIIGAALSITRHAQHTFESQPEQADVQQRIRVGVEGLRQDLVMAGAGTYLGPALGAMNNLLSPVMPYRAFGDAPDPVQGTRFRRDVISLMYVPTTTAQSVLSSALGAGALDIQIAPVPSCPVATATQVCGFSAGVRVLILDTIGHWDVFRVEQVGAGVMTLGHRGPATVVDYPTGSLVAEVRLSTYSLKVDTSTGVSQLVRHDGWATELPIADHVVAMGFAYVGQAEPPRLTGVPLDSVVDAATTYGPKPPPIGETQGSWPPGENCTFRVVDGVHVPRLAVLGSGLAELPSALLTDGPWCPDASAQNAFDADLLRLRSLRVTIRVQSAVASLRGPAGVLFLNGGTARGADRYVPDLEVQFDITPRNLGLGH